MHVGGRGLTAPAIVACSRVAPRVGEELLHTANVETPPEKLRGCSARGVLETCAYSAGARVEVEALYPFFLAAAHEAAQMWVACRNLSPAVPRRAQARYFDQPCLAALRREISPA